MKKTLLSLACISILLSKTDSVWAQQDPYTTHYAFNRMLYNPAVAGAKGRFCLTALSHYQYTGFEDRTLEFWSADKSNANGPKGTAAKNVGPKTQMFSFCAPVTKWGGLGIGFINDKLGYESSTHIKIDGAVRLPMGAEGTLAIGVEANILQKGIDGGNLKPLAPNDPRVPTAQESDRHTVFGAGAYYINEMSTSNGWRDLWVGLSALNLNHPDYEWGGGTVWSTPTTHTYLMGGITRVGFMGNADLNFHPSAMFKYNRNIKQLDVTALVEYQNKLWGGVAYRTTSDALSIMLGYSGFGGNFRGLRIGYSYDLTLSKIINVSSGTHEIQLNYCFEVKIVPPPKINILTPPFMNRNSD